MKGQEKSVCSVFSFVFTRRFGRFRVKSFFLLETTFFIDFDVCRRESESIAVNDVEKLGPHIFCTDRMGKKFFPFLLYFLQLVL